MIHQTDVYHRFCVCQHELLCHLRPVNVPAVPAHGRSKGNNAPHHQLRKARPGIALLVPDMQTACIPPPLQQHRESRPVFLSNCRPAGSLSTVKVIGLVPVAGMVKRTGCSGRTPKTRGPLMCGVGPALGVRMAKVSGSCVYTGPAEVCACRTPVAVKQKNRRVN